MAEDDIYGNKGKYEHFKLRYRQYLVEPRQRIYERGSVGKYVCKVASNLNYFEKLFTHFESQRPSMLGPATLCAKSSGPGGLNGLSGAETSALQAASKIAELKTMIRNSINPPDWMWCEFRVEPVLLAGQSFASLSVRPCSEVSS